MAVSTFLHDVCLNVVGRLVTGAQLNGGGDDSRARAYTTARSINAAGNDARVDVDVAAAGAATPPYSPPPDAPEVRAGVSWVSPTVCTLLTLFVLASLALGLLHAGFVRDIDDVWVPPRSTARMQKLESQAWFGADPFSRPFRVIIATSDVSMAIGAEEGEEEEEEEEEDEQEVKTSSRCPSASITNGILTSVARLRAAFAVKRAIETISISTSTRSATREKEDATAHHAIPTAAAAAAASATTSSSAMKHQQQQGHIAVRVANGSFRIFAVSRTRTRQHLPVCRSTRSGSGPQGLEVW